jgi:hypothetical protein
LIAEVKNFVNGLQDLTRPVYPVVHQENNIKLGVQQINDVNTLNLLAEVCEVDHPVISDAASEKSEILSIPTTRRREIEQWRSKAAPKPDSAIAEVESLTLAELKHRPLVYTQGHLPEEAMTGDYPSIQRDSLVLSTESPKDVATTRVLSLLTLIYLPATFVAVSLLDPYDRATGSDLKLDVVLNGLARSSTLGGFEAWGFFGSVVPLTVSALTVEGFFWFEIRRHRRKRDQGMEKGEEAHNGILGLNTRLQVSNLNYEGANGGCGSTEQSVGRLLKQE